MKMWSMKVVALLLVCYVCLSSGNAKVYFLSKNFNNTLHWDAVKTVYPEDKVLYSVWYKSDSMEEFKLKEDCHNITALSCDLTAETPSVYDTQYEARVFVNGSCHGKTTRFKPLAETVLGPPTLSIQTTFSSLHINVTLPLGPNGKSIGDIINRSTDGHSKSVIIYTLNITEPKWATMVNKTTTSRFVIRLNNNQSVYCGHVFYIPLSEFGRPNSQNAFFCVTLPVDHRMLLPWLLIGAAFLAAIVTMLVVCTYNYVKGGKQKNMPQSLVTAPGTLNKVLHTPDTTLSISKAEFCTPPRTVYTEIQVPGVKPNVPPIPTGEYSPQGTTLQASTGSSVGTDEHNPNPYTNTQDSSAQSSEIYSVVVVNAKNRENKDFQQVTTEDTGSINLPLPSHGEPWNKGGMSPTPATFHDLDATESNPARPLLLHTMRNPNGQLVLPLLFPQMQRSTGDVSQVSPLTSVRKLLLSDLIENKEGCLLASLKSFGSSEWSDSGCDDTTIDTPTLYSPSLTVAPDFHEGFLNTPAVEAEFESGYKQNWMPEILGAVVKNSCEYKRTNYL